MRLKNIVLKGFKSFPQETTIHFNENVTGIVGPNGSGKSNIVDAIRWVLGEQKGSELRLERMADVIFNGSKKKRPSNYAEVSLTFSNTRNVLPTEYQNITISRILYKSGESEYRLNHTPCRLKDINSLFLDTGIGPDSYNIIALGMVDDILSDKDHARRKMFEQAAGISKYKKRKREAILKLNNAENDLDRIEDLLFEIENNLKELEKQARRAKRYNNLKERYREESITLAGQKIIRIWEDSKDIQTQEDKLRDRISGQQADIRKREAYREKQKKDLIDREKILADRQGVLNGLKEKISAAENEKTLRQQKTELSGQQIDELKRDLEAGQIELEGLERKRIELRKSLEQQQGEYAAAEKRLRDQEARFSEFEGIFQEAEAALTTKNHELSEIDRQLTEIDKEKAICENRIELHEDEIRQREATLVSNRDQIQQATKSSAELQESISKLQADIQKEERRLADQKSFIKGIEDRLEVVRRQLSDKNRKLDATIHQKSLLKSMIQNLEGYPDSIKFLLKKWRSGVPLLSDVIHCQKQYKIAIEQFLDQQLNFFVVAGVEEAASAIQLLSDSQKGRANFFLHTVFDKYSPKRQTIKGCIPAVEVISSESRYQGLVHYLFRNVYLTELPLKDLVDLPEDAVVIHVDGTFVRRSISVGGGSVGLFEGHKLGRKQELSKLSKEIDHLREQVAKTEQEEKELETKLKDPDTNSIAEILEQKRGQLQELKLRLAEAQAVVEISGEQKLLKSREELDKMKALTEEKLSSLQGERSRKQQSRKTLEAEKQRLEKDFSEKKEKRNSLKDDLDNLRLQFVRHESEVASIRRELRYTEEHTTQRADSIRSKTEKISQLQNEVEQIKMTASQFDEALSELYRERKQKEGEVLSCEEDYRELRHQIENTESEIRTLREQVQSTQTELSAVAQQRSEFAFSERSILERMRVEFQTELEVEELRDWERTDDLDSLAEKVERAKGRLERYGEVNPFAVQAHEEMQTRYDDICGQRDDVIDARESLLETIGEIESTASEKFLSSFDRVRDHFRMVFRSLFREEDDCDLLLTNPDQPLEADIQIIAKPKGKKPKTLNQLSGGEKTLTAIALLFSLYLLKPAPFCVFDEVDAPLDDVNIGKFNQVIQKFSGDSQFIIITHNKLTMAEVDVIYGVYMEEQGVSSVSAVDFRSFRHQSLLESNGSEELSEAN